MANRDKAEKNMESVWQKLHHYDVPWWDEDGMFMEKWEEAYEDAKSALAEYFEEAPLEAMRRDYVDGYDTFSLNTSSPRENMEAILDAHYKEEREREEEKRRREWEQVLASSIKTGRAT